MINPSKFLTALRDMGVDFFSGVPDSLLKDFCACVSHELTETSHVITANEGAAIGLSIGHYLGTGQIPLVYMQNSGLGNIVNPLLSLASSEVYSTPMLLMIGWRGEPGVKDEPQHVHQGRVMLDMLKAMEIPFVILENRLEHAIEQVRETAKLSKEVGGPVAIVVRKGIFEKYSVSNQPSDLSLSREAAVIAAAEVVNDKTAIVATTGMISRELFEYRANNKMGHHADFLTVGGMGHASQIALGLAMAQPSRPVFCFDGDGAALMHLGSMAISGQSKCKNLIHILFNNGVHASVGGQPTVGFKIDFCSIAQSCGYKNAVRVFDRQGIRNAILSSVNASAPSFIEIQTTPDNRKGIGRPTSGPRENKSELMKFLGVEL